MLRTSHFVENVMFSYNVPNRDTELEFAT